MNHNSLNAESLPLVVRRLGFVPRSRGVRVWVQTQNRTTSSERLARILRSLMGPGFDLGRRLAL
jgi:hypothetical protein